VCCVLRALLRGVGPPRRACRDATAAPRPRRRAAPVAWRCALRCAPSLGLLVFWCCWALAPASGVCVLAYFYSLLFAKRKAH
jgi:hypothetical protein